MDRPSRVEGELAFEDWPDPFEVPAPARREVAPAPVATPPAASASSPPEASTRVDPRFGIPVPQ